MTVKAIVESTLYASAARVASPAAAEVYTSGRQRLHLVIDVTAIAATPSVVPTIDGYDTLSGKWYNLLTGVALVATGTTILKIGPGLTPVANVCAADILPGHIRLVMTHADADSITYSAAIHLAP